MGGRKQRQQFKLTSVNNSSDKLSSRSKVVAGRRRLSQAAGAMMDDGFDGLNGRPSVFDVASLLARAAEASAPCAKCALLNRLAHFTCVLLDDGGGAYLRHSIAIALMQTQTLPVGRPIT